MRAIGSVKRSSVNTAGGRHTLETSMLIRVKMSAGSVAAARPASQQAGSGASPAPALQQLRVQPIPTSVARKLIEREHYLHSLPGGTHLTFSVFCD